MKLIVSLITYNSAAYLSSCLASIATQTFQDFELVCRDNHSSDDSVTMVRRYAPEASIVEEPLNRGFSGGHNTTICKTESEYVCVLNPDLVLEPQYLEECIAFLDTHPRVGAVSGLLIRTRSLTDLPDHGIIDCSGIMLLRTGRVVLTDAGKSDKAVSQTARRVYGVPATAAIYRRSALEDIALEIDGAREYFDEDFFMYKEDIDLAVRLSLCGWDAYVVPAARAYHIRSTDYQLLRRSSPFINLLSYRNHWLLLIKSIPRSFLLRNGFWILLFEIAKFFYLLIHEPRTLTALFDVLKLREKMLKKRALVCSLDPRMRGDDNV